MKEISKEQSITAHTKERITVTITAITIFCVLIGLLITAILTEPKKQTNICINGTWYEDVQVIRHDDRFGQITFKKDGQEYHMHYETYKKETVRK